MPESLGKNYTQVVHPWPYLLHGLFLDSNSKSPDSLSRPNLSHPWLTCDIHYEADRVFAHAGAGVQAWILGRGITNLQHLLLYQRAVVGAQRAAIFGPDDGPRRRQRAAQLQHLPRVHWAHRGLRNLVFVRCVCRANGGEGRGRGGAKKEEGAQEVGRRGGRGRNKP